MRTEDKKTNVMTTEDKRTIITTEFKRGPKTSTNKKKVKPAVRLPDPPKSKFIPSTNGRRRRSKYNESDKYVYVAIVVFCFILGFLQTCI